jgi:peptide/nickel transport system substrate-binding protein
VILRVRLGTCNRGVEDPNAIRDKVKDAYQYLNAAMPFIPLVQSPKIIPFTTKYWTVWPAKDGINGNVVPMHSWSAAHRLIHQLKKAP